MIKIIKIDGKEFEVIPLRGREALRRAYFVTKVVVGSIARIASTSGVTEIQKKLENGDNFDFASVADFVFEEINEDTFMDLADVLLHKVLYEKAEFMKIWESKFGGDPTIAIELIVASMEIQFGFFSKIIPKYLEKINTKKEQLNLQN